MKKFLLLAGILCGFALTGHAQTTGELKIIDVLKQIAANGGTGGVTGAQRTPQIHAHTTDGTVSAGCTELIFIASSDFAGTVAGFPLAASAGLQIPLRPSDTSGAVSYTVSAGTLYSLEVR